MADSSGLAYENSIAVWYKKKAYYVPKETWEKTVVPDDLAQIIDGLVNNGAVLASIATAGEGVGCACYLINLDNIVPDTRSDDEN
jgi:hypothetical protein